MFRHPGRTGYGQTALFEFAATTVCLRLSGRTFEELKSLFENASGGRGSP